MVVSKDSNEHLETREDIFKRLTQNKLEFRMVNEFLKTAVNRNFQD